MARTPEDELNDLVWRLLTAYRGETFTDLARKVAADNGEVFSTWVGHIGGWRRGYQLGYLLLGDRAAKLAKATGYKLTAADRNVLVQYGKWFESEQRRLADEDEERVGPRRRRR